MKEKVLIAILFLFYLVGLIGILAPSQKLFFLSLSPYNLILSFTVLLIARNLKNTNWYLFLGIVVLTGYIVEWIGVHTSWLFGQYNYGENLGWKLNEIPIIIGFNWLLMIVGSASISARFFNNRWYEIISSALIMTAFDAIMEPVAIKSDFWHWKNEIIPIYNYVCWFGVGFLSQWVYQVLKLRESNKVHDALLLIMIVFFIVLNVF